MATFAIPGFAYIAVSLLLRSRLLASAFCYKVSTALSASMLCCSPFSRLLQHVRLRSSPCDKLRARAFRVCAPLCHSLQM